MSGPHDEFEADADEDDDDEKDTEDTELRNSYRLKQCE